jgi:hypothetical protein
LPAFLNECLSFPAGRHDDCVDAIGLAGQLLDKMVDGTKPKVAGRVHQDSWDKAFRGGDEEDGWKVV